MKPFNPILGETYQALWPDGSNIYIEHMSHHPPISRFYIKSKNYTIEGYYEFVAKIKSMIGNCINAQYKGYTRIRFNDGDIVEYQYPIGVINGIFLGARIIEWEENLNFKYYTNTNTNNTTNTELLYESNLIFTSKPCFYQSFKEKTDYFNGEIINVITKEVVCNVKGSPIEKLWFFNSNSYNSNNYISNNDFNPHQYEDNPQDSSYQEYWDFEKADLIKPTDIQSTMKILNIIIKFYILPSDCRYRTDMQALAELDIERADEEKVVLEVLQRKDKALRKKYSKERK